MAFIKQRERDMTQSSIENVSRRDLLKGAGVIGGFILAVSLPLRAAKADDKPPAKVDAPKFGRDGMPHGWVNNPKVFVAIATDGTVSIVCARSDMGQGVRTGLPLIVADEMEADWARVKVIQAPGDEVTYGNQDTDGSRSTRHFMLPMRQCGAAARIMLEQAAAKRWGVGVLDVEAKNNEVVNKKDGTKLGFGELAADAAALPVPATDTLKLKDPSQFRYIGKEGAKIVDGFDITTGRALFGQDVYFPGMKFAVVARPPVLGGKVKSYDGPAALAVPGVEKLVVIPSPTAPFAFQPLGGVAVVASNTYAAIKGREALKITWDDGPNADYDSVAYRAEMEATARKPGVVVRKSGGDVDAALAGAAKKLEAEYYIPHLAHATMEPPAATAVVKDGACEVWTSVQSPQAAHDLCAKYLGLAPEKVKVNVTLLGGGFGRKSKPDFAVEAALVAKEMDGKPVKVVWTREDDIRNGYYHTVSVERLVGGLDASGKTVAWFHNSTAPSLFALFMPDPKHEQALELGMGFVDNPFDIANMRMENGEAAAHNRIGWYRSVSNIPHAFAVQSFAAELAAAAGKDQKDYLLELIGPARIVDLSKDVPNLWDYGENIAVYPIDAGRLRKVTEMAADKGGWGRKLPPRHGLGIAAHRSFTTYVAAVVEAAVDEQGNLTIPRVDVAVDCGNYVNPDRIRSQIEGAVIMGIGLAMKTEITYKAGRVVQANLDDYEVTRMPEMPSVTNVHIRPADWNVPTDGIGEPGLPPIAPALTNAIFAAIGKRIRTLPIGQQLKA
jgi:isoquinoline 1-oxidoreductase beta subunit